MMQFAFNNCIIKDVFIGKPNDKGEKTVYCTLLSALSDGGFGELKASVKNYPPEELASIPALPFDVVITGEFGLYGNNCSLQIDHLEISDPFRMLEIAKAMRARAAGSAADTSGNGSRKRQDAPQS
jgi:hypothetical protein